MLYLSNYRLRTKISKKLGILYAKSGSCVMRDILRRHRQNIVPPYLTIDRRQRRK
ncbi:MAG: hypothetical protein ACP8RL_06600 [cyanobacterium endosymbiont of Rhopalodia inflata]